MFTARELELAANRVAHGLRALGVGRQDRVMTLLENSPEGVILFFATLKLGAIYVPVNTAHRGTFLDHQLRDADPTVLVVEADVADRLTPDVTGLAAVKYIVIVGDAPMLDPRLPRHGWADLNGPDDSAPGVAVEPVDHAALIYTGGTTGPSKGRALPHNYVAHFPGVAASMLRRTADDIMWTPLPLFHFNAIAVSLLGPLVTGGSTAIERKFSVSRFWSQINACGATLASMLSSLLVMIANDIDRPAEPGSGAPNANSTLRMVIGAPLPPEVDRVWREWFRVATCSYAYGTTQASLLSHLPFDAEPRLGTAGVVNHDDFDVRIFGDHDEELPGDSDGEIVCRPRRPNIKFTGYWHRPESTLACMSNSWFHTGDIGRIDEDDYLTFVDRKADYIRRRGENVSSWELEQTFHQHEAILDLAISSVPSDVGEDEIKLTAVLLPDATITEEELCRWSFSRLPYFAVPRYVELRTELPKNSTGRITKGPLRDDGVTPSTWDREAAGVTVPR
jgi:crotonobetaine/carnitine-CoA ligase